jgi:hypothetical protein
MKKFRKWLTKNKVFFEVFSFLFLGIASIIVGYFSYRTSQGQLEILRTEQSPIINIKREYVGDYEFLNIYNVGHHLLDFEISHKTYFIINKYQDSIITNPTDFYFEINDYYSFIYETGNTIGILAKVHSSEHTNKKSLEVIGECRELFGDDFQFSSYEHLIKIKYFDINKQPQTKYFILDAFSTLEISKTKFESISKKIKLHRLTGHKYLTTIKNSDVKKDIRKIFDDVIPSTEKHEEK